MVYCYANPDESKIIKLARHVNDSKPKWVIEKINKLIEKNGNKKAKLAFFGLSFKANIDDLRESPALDIINYFDKSHESQILVVEQILLNYQNCLQTQFFHHLFMLIMKVTYW